ncbi:MAG: HAD family hydrolase [Terriglobia bacterium]
MLRAIIFDFDGVVVDSEPLIMDLTRRMAMQEGWSLSAEEYYREYLALDDRGIVEHLFRTHGRPLDTRRRDELVHWKERLYAEAIEDGLPAVPGAPEFVRACARRFCLGIASGSLGREVGYLLSKLGLASEFAVLATADDCERSKPDPCSYLTALARLQALDRFQKCGLRATECLAIEDAPAGIQGAHAAGLKCLALAYSRPAKELRQAEWICESFAGVSLRRIEEEFERV